MKKHNILYICDYAAKYSGNFIASISALTNQLVQKNDVYFLFPTAAKGYSWLDSLPVSPSHIIFCDFTPFNLLKVCAKLAKELNSRTTVVHTHFVADWCLLAIKACFRNIICHFHMTAFETTTIVKKIKRLVRLIIYRDIIIVGVSEAVTYDLKQFFPRCTCECIPNAINFLRLSSMSNDLPDTISIDKNQFNILIHGTHFLRKGVDLAIKAIEQIPESTGNFKLFITSNTPDETAIFVKDYALNPENIQIVEAVENIKAVYDSADLFLSPSRLEAFGYAVAEAAFSNCLVIASDTPGQNTMKDIPGILWVDTDNVESLKNAILQAFAAKESGTKSEIKALQKEYVAGKYDISHWVAQTLMLYNKFYPHIW